MSKESYNALVSSIRANGQYEPITVNENGIILEGYHRLRACNQLKIKPIFEVKKFDDPLSEKLFIIDINLQRRQLTVAQRVQLSLQKKPILQQLAKRNQSLAGQGKSVQICTPLGRINDIIARDSGVSARQVSKVETILEKGSEGEKRMVLNGRTRIDKAYKRIKNDERRTMLIEEAKSNQEAKSLFHTDVIFENKLACKLFQGDFREVARQKIPDSSVDLIFTDPPYDKESLSIYADLAKMASRVLKDGGSLVTYISQYALPDILDHVLSNSNDLHYWWEICIALEGPFARHWQRQVVVKWKCLLWFVKGNKPQLPDYLSDLVFSKKANKILHDWQQGGAEADHAIKLLTVENQIVLDPFLGAGTTAVSAIRLQRRFIGIDINLNALDSVRSNLKLNFVNPAMRC
jgi:16S rRNA G966 N2-methylase RsmD